MNAAMTRHKILAVIKQGTFTVCDNLSRANAESMIETLDKRYPSQAGKFIRKQYTARADGRPVIYGLGMGGSSY
jgi:hypothetical protein